MSRRSLRACLQLPARAIPECRAQVARQIGNGIRPQEHVHHPVVAFQRDRHPRCRQFPCIFLAFIAQGIELGRRDEGGGQSAQILCAQRRGMGMRAVGRGLQVMSPEPLHAAAREFVAVGILPVRAGLEVVIHDRYRQDLADNARRSPVARNRCSDRRKVAAGGEARGIPADGGGIGGDPPRGRIGVLDGRGKIVLGRVAIVDRGDEAARGIGDGPAVKIRGLQVSHHPPATVKEDQHGPWSLSVRRVDPDRDVAVGSRNVENLDPGNRLSRAEPPRHLQGACPGLQHRQGFQRRQCRHLVNEFLCPRVQWHPGPIPPLNPHNRRRGRSGRSARSWFCPRS